MSSRIVRRSIYKLVLLLLLLTFLIFTCFEYDYDYEDEQTPTLPRYQKRNDHKAFITSAYYYPNSKSLGNNSLALVMSITGSGKRREWMNLEQWNQLNNPLIIVKAENETSSIVVKAKYQRITPHEHCQLISIFVTVPLLPNVKTISMVGDDGSVDIPFQIPPTTPHDVVICINPVILADLWQNFIFMTHLYKHFDGFVNLYLISAIDSVYSLMKEYEKEGYLRIQLWPSVKFKGVPKSLIDPYYEVEAENRASASTDCLLRYKETAKFITFLDFNNLLIPTHGSTFVQEFQSAVWSWRNVVYLHYPKEDHEMLTLRDPNQLSFTKMFQSLKNGKIFRTGQIVANPKLMNYTWMHGPPTIPRGYKWVSAYKRSIINVNTKWLRKYNETVQPILYNASLDNYMDSKTLQKIEEDVERMKRKPGISRILRFLPTYPHLQDALHRCHFHNQTYHIQPKCPGAHLCGIPQFNSINCVHVTATYKEVPTMKPITYYYATNPTVVLEKGCYPPH